MTIKQTSVNINIEKWQILKTKGYKLQDIIDNAFNSLLSLEDDNLTNIIQTKENYLLKIDSLAGEIEQINKNYGSEIKKIEQEKTNLKKQYEKDLKNLKTTEKQINKNYESELKKIEQEKELLKLQINNLDDNIIQEKQNKAQKQKETEYNKLIRMYNHYYGAYKS